MHGRTYHRLAWTLAAAAVWGVCAVGGAQAQAPPMLAADPGYEIGADSAMTVPTAPALYPDTYLVSSNNSSFNAAGLADRVADLEAELKKMKDKEAAAKRKAAGKPSVAVGGRIYYDWASFDQNAASLAQAGDCRDGTEARSTRVFLKGDAFQVLDYKMNLDFAGDGNAVYKDVYMTVNELPWVGHVRVGHFFECYGLEAQTSSKYTTFMERSLVNNFGDVGARKPGVMAFNYNQAETMTWAIGAFTALSSADPPRFPYGTIYDDNGGTALSMRYTWLPWYDWATEGRGLLHLGIAYSYRNVPELAPNQNDRYRIRLRPESHLAERIVNTGWMDDASDINALNAEAAWVYGPLSIQAEYMWLVLNRTANADPTFDVGYVFVSYFVTGEHRPYQRTSAVFGRVKPFENFFRVRAEDGNIYTGKGAWELAYRASYANLNDAGVRGGRVLDHTFGLNWYLSPYTRLMFNYVRSEVNDTRLGPGTGVANIFQMRAQIDF